MFLAFVAVDVVYVVSPLYEFNLYQRFTNVSHQLHASFAPLPNIIVLCSEKRQLHNFVLGYTQQSGESDLAVCWLVRKAAQTDDICLFEQIFSRSTILSKQFQCLISEINISWRETPLRCLLEFPSANAGMPP